MGTVHPLEARRRLLHAERLETAVLACIQPQTLMGNVPAWESLQALFFPGNHNVLQEHTALGISILQGGLAFVNPHKVLGGEGTLKSQNACSVLSQSVP